MNILVTGGAGFIGSQVVDEYCAAGHQVSVIDNLVTGKRKNLNPRAVFHEVDIRDAARVAAIFAQGRFDVLNHLAAQIDVRKSVDDPPFDASVNIVGGVTLLEQAARTGVKKVLFSSTGGAIYGEQDYFPADEKHPTRPISPYGIAKLCTENYLFYYGLSYGLEYVCLRYANVYGPRQNPEGEAGVVAIFCRKFLSGEKPIINGDGLQTRDYVYVGDVVQANLVALDVKGSRTFNIGTGVETTVNELFLRLRDLTGTQCDERHGPAKKGEQMRSLLTSDLIKSVTGWKPTVQLAEGLAHTVKFFRDEAKG
jgi:UDP-glucose 4-epimerase